MAQKKQRDAGEINAASMADIAFLLLIFFLVATTFPSDKGISMTLPPKPEEKKDIVEINKRNLFTILVNSNGQLLVEETPMKLGSLKSEVKAFITNNGANPKSSESPQKAIVSLKADRGTRYEVYIQVLDQVQAAYHEIRAKELGWTVEEYLSFDKDRASDEAKERYKQVQDKYPMLISEADPNKGNSE